jgi:ribosomal-protein-alanine N-acetyltransferase
MQQQNPSQFPVLLTEWLILRRLVPSDAPEILKLRSDERVNQYIDRPKTTKLHEAEDFINKIEAGINKNESFYWAISFKDDIKLIGTICLWNIDNGNATIEIGYELHPDYQGKGLMQQALLKVIEYGFQTLQFKTIVAYPNAANERSVKLLKKNNFQRDLVLEDEFYKKEFPAKEVIYSLKKPSV